MPKVFSLGAILGILGTAYIANTVWTFYGIYFPAWCKSTDVSVCVSPRYICSETDFYYQGWISRSAVLPEKTSRSSALQIFEKEAPCAEAWEDAYTFDISSIYRPTANYYLHILAVPKHKGEVAGTTNLTPGDTGVVYQKTVMTKMLVEERTAINLIAVKNDDDVKKNGQSTTRSSGQLVQHWHTRLRLHVMETPIIFDRMSIPHELYQHLKFKSDASGAVAYQPLVFIDHLSGKRDEYVPLKDKKQLNLTIDYSPMSVGKIRLISMIGASMEQMKTFGLKEADLEDVISIFTETNFYILTLTICVTVLHLVFDFLAFKNDITFWRKRNTVAGLSGRTILWRAFSQIIVFLYLLEEKSSLLISVPAGIACGIEIWKVLKLWKFTGFERKGLKLVPQFDTATKAEQSSDDIDAVFFHKLFYFLMPLILGGAVYSLFYVPHKSWYSWTVQSAVNGVYAFGFLFMLPQLYLNYKLKSVAHLPWKVFSYKALNTFIDDLFAFIVKMPLAHRLACFRDDIVFLFYLAQWYMYPVDKSRANEFGQSFDGFNEIVEGDVVAAGDGPVTSAETKKTK
ncbi:hypothetical protein RvY_12363 [Ramazzottius varieornatus]|uniref:Lipid scramblase CLPTM1L n=1 Tax=Ramazzottius varieornatus TaxID=947166 RepID=A0A1D1VJB3_RAMVA|nr:hypothetical protein RvY_12363 [Ramazzottius varieornatus]